MSRSTADPSTRRPRRARGAAVAVLAATAALALVGCENKAGTAAFVGGHRITDSDLRRHVEDGLRDPQVRKVVDDSLGGDVGAYRRVVLDNDVRHVLLTEAARRLHVSVSSSDVDDRMRQVTAQAGGQGQVRDLFARSGLTVAAGRQAVADEALLTEVGFAAGAPRADEAALRSAYQAARAQFTTLSIGVIQVPDQKTASTVLGQLNDDPASFATLAARYAGGQTTPKPQQVQEAQTNPDLASRLDKLKPGEGIVFSQPAAGGAPGLFAVIQLAARDVLPFESARPQLESDSLSKAESVATPYLAKLAKQLHVRINPRYGKWDYTADQIGDLPDPVVKARARTAPGGAQAGQGGQAQSGQDGQGQAGTPPQNGPTN